MSSFKTSTLAKPPVIELSPVVELGHAVELEPVVELGCTVELEPVVELDHTVKFITTSAKVDGKKSAAAARTS